MDLKGQFFFLWNSCCSENLRTRILFSCAERLLTSLFLLLMLIVEIEDDNEEDDIEFVGADVVELVMLLL